MSEVLDDEEEMLIIHLAAGLMTRNMLESKHNGVNREQRPQIYSLYEKQPCDVYVFRDIKHTAVPSC